jgi:hypothetical protein
MNESENASTDDESVWDYIQNNPKIIGLPITDTKGIDLLSALRDVYMHTKKDPEAGLSLLTILANFLVAAAQGEAQDFIDEVTVIELTSDLDTELRKVLNEGH